MRWSPPSHPARTRATGSWRTLTVSFLASVRMAIIHFGCASWWQQNQATPTSTPTLSVTSNPTETPTATVTPPGQVGGELSPIPGDTIDLDTLTLNSGDEDLAYQADENGYHWLSPQGGALIGVFGNTEPSLASCQSASDELCPDCGGEPAGGHVPVLYHQPGTVWPGTAEGS